MAKTEVYSWRMSPRLKGELQEAARVERKSMAVLLDEMAEDWLARSRSGGEDAERQRRLRAAAMRSIGTIQSGKTRRAENARAEVRSRIARRHGRPSTMRACPSLPH